MRATERGLQPHAMHLRDAVLLAVWAGAARVLGAARPRVGRVPQREEEGERSWAGGVGPRRGARGRLSCWDSGLLWLAWQRRWQLSRALFWSSGTSSRKQRGVAGRGESGCWLGKGGVVGWLENKNVCRWQMPVS